MYCIFFDKKRKCTKELMCVEIRQKVVFMLVECIYYSYIEKVCKYRFRSRAAPSFRRGFVNLYQYFVRKLLTMDSK
jgi:hypothetical protein